MTGSGAAVRGFPGATRADSAPLPPPHLRDPVPDGGFLPPLHAAGTSPARGTGMGAGDLDSRAVTRCRRATACAGLGILVAPAVARADIAPTPPIVYAPPAFLVLLVGAYLLLMLGAGLGVACRRTLGRPVGRVSQKRAVATAVTVALALTAVLVVISETMTRRNRAERLSRSSVTSNLGAIRSTEVAYFAEWNVWVGGQPLTPVPDRRGDDRKVRWEPNTRFSILGFAPEGSVPCSYALEGPAWSTDGFTARAECDYDKDGQVAIYRITDASSEIVKSGAPY